MGCALWRKGGGEKRETNRFYGRLDDDDTIDLTPSGVLERFGRLRQRRE
jgi:hypothetical protein